VAAPLVAARDDETYDLWSSGESTQIKIDGFANLTAGSRMNYKFTYSKFFNVIFHLGVAVNVVVVLWLMLMLFEVI